MLYCTFSNRTLVSKTCIITENFQSCFNKLLNKLFQMFLNLHTVWRDPTCLKIFVIDSCQGNTKICSMYNLLHASEKPFNFRSIHFRTPYWCQVHKTTVIVKRPVNNFLIVYLIIRQENAERTGICV